MKPTILTPREFLLKLTAGEVLVPDKKIVFVSFLACRIQFSFAARDCEIPKRLGKIICGEKRGTRVNFGVRKILPGSTASVCQDRPVYGRFLACPASIQVLAATDHALNGQHSATSASAFFRPPVSGRTTAANRLPDIQFSYGCRC